MTHIRFLHLLCILGTAASPAYGEERAPVPPQEAQQESLELVNEVFQEEINAAKTAGARSGIAKKLIQQAEGTEGPTADRYVLLKLAQEMAAGAGDYETAIDAAKRTAHDFSVDELSLATEVWKVVSKITKSSAEQRVIAEQISLTCARAIKAGQIELASELNKLAIDCARKSRNKDLLAAMTEQGQSISELGPIGAELKQALEVLENKPSDPESNLVAGKFRCFIQGNWEMGLLSLVLCNDPLLKDLANKELSETLDGTQMLALADGWLKVAGNSPEYAREEIQEHAAQWYIRAYPSLTGLSKVRVQKKILEMSPWGLEPIPVYGGQSVAGPPKNINNASIVELNLPAADIVSRPQWSDDGAFLFLATKDGKLSKISAPDFQVISQLATELQCSSLSRSSEGLVAVLGGKEIWVIEESTLYVKRKIEAPGAHLAASSPATSTAYVTPEDYLNLAILNLKTGKTEKVLSYKSIRTNPRFGHFSHPTVTPDGKYFLCGSDGAIWRFAIGPAKFLFQEKSENIASQSENGIDVGPASKLVAYTKGGGNWQRGYGTYVYEVKNLRQPKLKIESGAYPRKIGFDGVSGKVYAQNHDYQLMLFSKAGAQEATFQLTRRGDQTQDLIVHPAGSRLLVHCSKLIWVHFTSE